MTRVGSRTVGMSGPTSFAYQLATANKQASIIWPWIKMKTSSEKTKKKMMSDKELMCHFDTNY